MIVTSDITLQFWAKPLFQKVSVRFGEGNRYGLIGANGCGKSTFMKILGRDLEPSGGELSIDAHDRVGKLRQDQFAYEDQRVLDVVMMGHEELWAAIHERDAIYANPDATQDDYMHAAELESRVGEYDGYTAEARAGELLIGVGIPIEQHNGPMSAVAPGWKLRVLLAQALFSNPDILLLDEPTNHLDLNAIRWLEDVLDGLASTMVIISHDRHFLNSVCTHIADLDYNTIKVYPGNYDDYMFASTQARQQLVAANAKAKEKVVELQAFVRRFSANASKARQATSRARQIEKIKIEDIKPSSRQYPFIRFDIDDKEKLHRVAIEVQKMEKAYAGCDPLFRNINFRIEAGERVAIIGPNGIGKTTLLRCLAGDLAPDRGAIKWAEKARIGYFAQDHADDFADGKTLSDWLAQWGRRAELLPPAGTGTRGATTTRSPQTAGSAGNVSARQNDDDQIVRATLGRLLFTGDDAKKSVRVISGGEEGRMLFGKLMLQRPNILLLDEPTNHLDMESIESLNTALEKYQGTLIFVSHDREFVSSLATRVIEMTPQGVQDFGGNYEDFLRSRGLAA